jgi:hypothetical protein
MWQKMGTWARFSPHIASENQKRRIYADYIVAMGPFAA